MDEISMSEQLSFMDMLQPWPHHLHIWEDSHGGARVAFAACDCGWIGARQQTKYAAVETYKDHIDRMS